MDPRPDITKNTEALSLREEKAQLERALRKKPFVFMILSGAAFLLAVSFLRISLETYASPGDEALIGRIGTVMLTLAVLFLAAAVVFLILFIVKVSKRKKLSRRLQEINRILTPVPGPSARY